MKIGSVCYVPPPKFRGAEAFLANIKKFKASNEMILYSDHRDYNFMPCLAPEGLHPEALKRNPKWAINNAIFATGVRLAAKCGFTHIIYLESDCRIGCDGWDAIIFDEYFRLPFPPIAAGSLVSHACVNGGPEFYARFTDMISENRHSGKRHLIPIYGVPVPPEQMNQFPKITGNYIKPGDADERYKPAVYPNGALGVYDVAWLCEIFHLNPDGTHKPGHSLIEDFCLQPAWDHVLGLRMYDRFGADLFDVVAHLDSVFSSYGDRLSTESERLQMLRDKRAVAVHQVKSNLGL